MAKKPERTRNWTFIVYPESAPENWRSILDDYHVQWIESPLHDRDVNPDGTIKKAHWHILILYDGVKSYDQVKTLTDKLNSPIPKRCESARGLVRYMIHMDNPEKYQYQRSAIVGHCGADVESYFEMTTTNRLDKLKEMAQYILDKHVTTFSDFIIYCIEHDDDWFTIAAEKNTLFLNKLIDSEWKISHQNVYKK
ncbi:replication protein [Limosilactobacillus reuteri]|uniref:replication protein n=1 Tax=Limosilactobacillus reuteri TaxID=1598 RepID=UPI001E4472F4|nr:replication protein [Limosilactobacillus reuteri]MCC4361945.1 replication protein [Limosilactobacillus reuteri]MCC4363771.1 replication protein [Limosilactobacillus reuteri]